VAYAKGHRKLKFHILRLGLADEQLAKFFKDAPMNCVFPEAWKPWLGEQRMYWRIEERGE
jgi:hypothetical protein